MKKEAWDIDKALFLPRHLVKPWEYKKKTAVVKKHKKPYWSKWNTVAKKRYRKPRVDRFAFQKQLYKTWKSVDRSRYSTYLEYIKSDPKLSAIYKGAYPTRTLSQLQGFLDKPAQLYSMTSAANDNGDLMQNSLTTKTNFNYLLTKQAGHQSVVRKQPLTTYDKVFYYYTLQTPLTLYAHKAFILLEMQLNATLVRAKLVPYLFMVRDLCFYRLVHINNAVVKNPYQVVSLYDAVSIPVYLHNYMYYRQYRIQYYPQTIGIFFKKYWAHFMNYTNNKVWLLSNFITSDVTAEAIIFDYPNITLYMGPFKRFTKLYYKNHPYAPKGKHRHLNHTHTVLKLKLFEYAAFYR